MNAIKFVLAACAAALSFTMCTTKSDENDNCDSDTENENTPIPLSELFPPDSINDWPMDSAEYNRFQSFDMFSVTASGEVVKEPFVYIKETPDMKIVRLSNDVDNPYLFKRMDGYWFSPHGRNFKDDDYGKICDVVADSHDGIDFFMRFIKNDTIYELQQIIRYSYNNFAAERRYTRDECVALSPRKIPKEIQMSQGLYQSVKDIFARRYSTYGGPASNERERHELCRRYQFKKIGDHWYEIDLYHLWSDPVLLFDKPMMFFDDGYVFGLDDYNSGCISCSSDEDEIRRFRENCVK